MHYAKFLLPLFVGAASAQSVSTIVSDLNNIKTLTDGLTSSLKSFNGQIAQAVPILSATNKLEAAIKSATTDAGSVSAASASDQAMVLTAAQGLYPSIISSLQATVADKAKFAQAGITSQVTMSLQTLKGLSDKLSAALSSKATGPYKTAATQLTSAIDAAFTSALAGNSPSAMTLSPVPSAGGGSSMTSAAASSSAAATSKAMVSSYAMASSMPMASSYAASTPVATPAPMTSAAAATSAPPAPVYTGAAGKNAASIGGAALLAAAVLAF